MGKFYRFRPLEAGSGFKRIAKVSQYKKASPELVDNGLCAAMCMRWLARDTVPATDEEIREVQALQRAYEKKVRDTNSEIQGEKLLAAQCGFTMKQIPHFPKPTGDKNVAIQYWKGVGTLGTAISTYVNGKLERARADELGLKDLQELTSSFLPCAISLVIAVPQIDVNGEQHFPNDRGEFKVDDGPWQKLPYGGSHGVALKPADEGRYHCLDPSAGVYEIDNDALTGFFDALHDCYKNLYDPVVEEGAKIHVDLQLHRIFVLSSEVAPLGGAARVGGGQPVEPMQLGGRAPSTVRTSARPNEELIAFLGKRGISGDAVLAILAEFGVNSLSDLKITKEDPDLLGQLKQQLQGRPIVIKAVDKLPVEAIDNAIFYSENEGAEAQAKTLADFLAQHDVLASGLDKDKLLSILRSGGVASLQGLKLVKEKGKNDAKLTALSAKVTAANQEAGASFESITAAMVAVALRGGASEVSQELKDFIAKKGLPPGTEKELAEFGVTTLEQFKAVKEDKAAGGSLDQLKAKLDNSGIRGATQQIDGIKVADIEQEIAEANAPDAQEARQRSAELAKAIQDAQALREKVEKTAGTEFSAVKGEMENQYRSVLKTIGDVSGADFTSAAKAAVASQKELVELLSGAIENATAIEGILGGVKKAPRPLAAIIKEQEMLCGFLISPQGAFPKHSELVKLPENPERMIRAPGEYEDFSRRYKGSKTKSFAASTAQQASRTLAVAAEASGAFFVGSGVGAVSAAAKYGDSQMESEDKKSFESTTSAECGEIRYVYVPKQGVQFLKDEIHLSDKARGRLGDIAGLPADQQADKIKGFYDDFGSHFFLRYALGGRYQFTAEGKSTSKTGTGLLVTAVAQTTEWAASASGSYAGIGGAAQAAASVKGQRSVASAQGDRFALNFDDAQVMVKTAALGGAGPAPRDVWAGSLRYNSTWAVIDREQPIAVWDLVRQDDSLNDDIKSIAPALEKTWVRQVFLGAVQTSHPVLYNYLKANTAISTAGALEDAVERLRPDVEPEFSVVVAVNTGWSAQEPKAVAGLNEKGLKLIGGGAIVNYEGPANILTGSYPQDNSWVATAKSHLQSNETTVTACAIYLSDPYDQWDVKMVSAKSEAKSGLPEATAKLPPGYALTGGGALVDWSGGKGIMLTACCPEMIDGKYTAWKAKGKYHIEPDTGHATAWVFGIRPKNGVETTPSKIDVMTAQGNPSHVPELTEYPKPSEEVIVGGGAAVTWKEEKGGMLTRCGLNPRLGFKAWQAVAKTHFAYDELELTMWVIRRKGELQKIEE